MVPINKYVMTEAQPHSLLRDGFNVFFLFWCRMLGVGCRMKGAECRVWAVGCRVQGVGIWVWGVGCAVFGVRCIGWGAGCGVWSAGSGFNIGKRPIKTAMAGRGGGCVP